MYQKPDVPLSIAGVLDDGFSLLKVCFTRVLPLALIAAYGNSLPRFTMVNSTNPAETAGPAFAIASLLGMMFSLLCFAAIVARINAISLGHNLSLGESLAIGLRRFFPLLLCWILYLLALVGGIIALVIPGLILGVSLVLAPYLLITDSLGPLESLRRSHRIVWGNWWRTAALFGVVFFILAAAYLCAGLIGAMTAVSDDAGAGLQLLEWVVLPLITAVVTPITYAFSIAILNDLKLRREGSDLVERIDAIA